MISTYLIDYALELIKKLSGKSDKQKLVISMVATIVFCLLIFLIKYALSPSDITVGDLDNGKTEIDRSIEDTKKAVNSTTPPSKSETDAIGVKEATTNQDSDDDAM